MYSMRILVLLIQAACPRGLCLHVIQHSFSGYYMYVYQCLFIILGARCSCVNWNACIVVVFRLLCINTLVYYFSCTLFLCKLECLHCGSIDRCFPHNENRTFTTACTQATIRTTWENLH